MNDLSDRMRKRLEEWRKKEPKKEDVPKPMYRRTVRGDYGDDIRDFERKIENMFIKEKL